MKKLIILAILVLLLPALAIAAPDEARGIVTNVVDGDTIDVQLQQHNSLVSSDSIRIRFADIDCPEMSTSQGPVAKAYTSKWLQNAKVYLDIDNNHRTDNYGRYVAVVYLANPDGSLNTTQNFNRMLLDSGHACIWDFSDNEFSPADWWGGSIPSTACIKSDSSTSKPIVISSSPSSTSGQFVGSMKSNKYHYPSCQWAHKISPSNEIWFSSSDDARAHGYLPCKVCHPP